ncbi:hypothetical protein KVR01_012260 [Diaporthe batatas]|uniref:uncharacterized protein n=1 Tax=Diaporthe batatas TaxID=748121 RepID=UPI001D046C68|nr:uncharacterized protein KVR01_012260 [Diaporthe batatas]KAG8157988.1 hypothetical protein KVR01_012260 [Diaporthe batatas]
MVPPHPSSAVKLETNGGYVPEIWTWYALGILILILRHVVRLRTVGIQGYQGDDYLSIISMGLYTVDTTMGYFAYYTGGNIDVTADEVTSLSDADVRILEMGSKMEFVTWYTYPGFVWVLKFCILFFYRRLTLGLIKERTLKFLFVFCGVTWAALIIAVSSTCRPFRNNWTIRPLPGEECIFRAQNFKALAALNISTDMAILTIPAPMIWQLRIPLWKRIGVTLLLCGGLFVISAAIIRAALTLTGTPSVLNINLWGYRETVIALLAVTAPVLSPMFRPGFWTRGVYVGRPADDQQRDAEEEIAAMERGRRRRLMGSWFFGSSLLHSSLLTIKSSVKSAVFTTRTRAAEVDPEMAEAPAPAQQVLSPTVEEPARAQLVQKSTDRVPSETHTSGNARPKPVNFGVIVFPAFQLLDVFGPLDALSLLSRSYNMNLYIIAATMDPVSTKRLTPPDSGGIQPGPSKSPGFGTTILPTHTFSTAPDLDVLVVPGGQGTRARSPAISEAIGFIRERFDSLQYLITVCTGAGLAARSGVLDGRRATTNKLAWEETTALRPQVDWVHRARWVNDGNIWTSSGISAGIDVTFAWIEDVYGADVAKDVADRMEYTRVTDPDNDPFAGPRD